MSPASHGFRHFRRAPAGEEDRVPPGQYVTQDFPALPAETITADIHCVTRWSKLEPSVVTIGLEPPDWPGHRAGQHLDVG
jgi:DMSO/TMAO reductase YedYZ molybdopterin-dependent catalytic subunit